MDFITSVVKATEATKAYVDAQVSATKNMLAPMESKIEALSEQIKSLPTPVDGKDGKDGADGATPSIEHLEKQVAEALATIKNGADGKDGKDFDPSILETPLASLETAVKSAEESIAKTSAEVLESVDKAVGARLEQLSEVALIKAYDPDTVVPAGTLVEFEGDVFVTLKASNQNPQESNHFKRLMHRPTHHGAYKTELRILKGDSVMSSRGSLFVACVDSPVAGPEAQNTVAGDWKLAVKSVKGDAGRDGVDGKDVDPSVVESLTKQVQEANAAVANSRALVESLVETLGHMTNRLKALEEKPEGYINGYKGVWHTDVEYQKGDLVRFETNNDKGMYLAKSKTRGAEPTNALATELWTKLL